VLGKTPEGVPTGVDLLMKDLGLTEDLALYVVVSNAGMSTCRRVPHFESGFS